MSATSRFVFRRYSGSYQLKIQTADDLDLLLELAEPRWAATSAPHIQLLCDPEFLRATDSDGNGRLRLRELQDAWRWLRERLRDRSGVTARSDALALDALELGHPDGQAMKALGARLLAELKEGSGRISLAQVRAFKSSYAQRFPNGDGVLTAAQATDPEVKALIEELVAAGGGTQELSGAAGVDQAGVEAALAQARALVAWADEEGRDAALRPLGDESDGALDLVERLRPKVEQFFAQGDLFRFEVAAQACLQASTDELAALDVSDPTAIRAWLEHAPLARPSGELEAALPLTGKVNPVFAADLTRLGALAPKLVPELGPGSATRLTRPQWQAVRDRLAPRAAWRARRPAGADTLTVARARERVDGAAPGRLLQLLEQDRRASEELRQVQNLERTVLYQRWLLEVANNFASFPALFIPGQLTLFQVGRLVLDGRELSFCTLVRDRAAHKAVAERSGMFLVYATLSRKEGDQTRTMDVACALTSGTRGGVAVGKRGVFYDREGKEWDAQVVDLVVNPISLLEAAVSPFTRLKALVTDRVQKLIAGRLEGMESSAGKAVETGIDTAAPAAPAAAPAGGGGANIQTLLIGGGVLFTALSATATYLIKTLSEVNMARVGLALLITVAAIMGLSALLGWFKLRARDLASALEACEWAVNMRMFLTRRHSLLFTRVPPLPPGSKTEHLVVLLPPGVAERGGGRLAVLVLVLAAALAALGWKERAALAGFWKERVAPHLGHEASGSE